MTPDDTNIDLKIERLAEGPENLYRDELTELRIDRLGQRLALISVLLPILIIVILALGYLDLKRRVIGLQDSGSASVQNLSDDLASRFSTLSVRVAELEQGLDKRLLDLGKQNADQAARLVPLAEELKRLAAAKADRGEVKQAAAALEKQMVPLIERLDGHDQVLRGLKDEIEARTAGLDRLLGSVKTDLAAMQKNLAAVEANTTVLFEDLKQIKEDRQALQAQVTSLAALKADQKTVDAALRRQLETVQGQVQASADALDKRLDKLTQQLQQIQQMQRPAAPAARPAVQPSPKVPAAASEPDETPARPDPAPAPAPNIKPGQIIEKPLN